MTKPLYMMLFKAFSNTTRWDIIHLLKKEPLTVSEICEKLHFEQSRVSHNLKYLESCGFVVWWKYGKWIKYSLNKDTVLPILEMCEIHVKKHKKELENKKEILKLIFKQMKIAQPEDHVCGCASCIELPAIALTTAGLKNQHTCKCEACVANFHSIIKINLETDLREDHTCECYACSGIQKTLSDSSML